MSRKKYPQNDKSIGGRLRSYRKHKSINTSDFSKLLEISQGSLSDIEHNKRLPSAKSIKNIIQYADIDIHWLYTGEGQMIRNEPENVAPNELIEVAGESRGVRETSPSGMERRLQELESAIVEMKNAIDKQNMAKEIARLTNKIEILQNTIMKEIPPEGIEERRKCMQILETVIGPLAASGP